jgi:release factor glutamine methyltransferase
MRVADNRIATVLRLYRTELAPLYSADEARAIARTVFQARLGLDAAALEMHRDQALSESELLAVYTPIARLRDGEPLQYVLGHAHFNGQDLEVGPGVLIPRPETEEMVDHIVQGGPYRGTIVDIGTGSGCIAIALKRAFPEAQVRGIDVSADALAIAQRNGRRCDADVEWAQADVFDPDFVLPADTALVVSNPPYVPRSEAAHMQVQVHAHEPHIALFVDDADPLLYYRRLGALAHAALPSGGHLWLEGHYRHTPAVGDLLREMGFRTVEVRKDLSGHHRFIHAIR